jgi:hypothetical protein
MLVKVTLRLFTHFNVHNCSFYITTTLLFEIPATLTFSAKMSEEGRVSGYAEANLRAVTTWLDRLSMRDRRADSSRDRQLDISDVCELSCKLIFGELSLLTNRFSSATTHSSLRRIRKAICSSSQLYEDMHRRRIFRALRALRDLCAP